MPKKPGVMHELKPVSFDPNRKLEFPAVSAYLGRGKSVDLWTEVVDGAMVVRVVSADGSVLVRPDTKDGTGFYIGVD